MQMKAFLFGLIGGITLSSTASANCWIEAGERYGISPTLLWAIASAESDFNPRAHNVSHIKRTGSRDIGLMQINSRALSKLKAFGIDEAKLWEPCTNIFVGAWILADKMKKLGPTWDAVGAYNAACTTLSTKGCIEARSKYAWRVYSRSAGARQQPARRMRTVERTPLTSGVKRAVSTIQTVSFNGTSTQRESDEK